MNNMIGMLVLTIVIFTSGGCVVSELGQTLKGDYYLKSDQPDKGRESFRQDVEENPDSAISNYYYGRFLLQENNNKEALIYLKKASALAPDEADYHFWKGVAFGANKKSRDEIKSYNEALSIDADHLQSLIYLGHIQLAKKKYKDALALYDRALNIESDSPVALYNRALILHRQGKTAEEKEAWIDYLSLYPTGGMAIRATEFLNAAGNYNFRNHTLGVRTVTTEKIRFLPLSSELADSSHESLMVLGTVFSHMGKGTLQVVTYQNKNKELAHARAVTIKKYLLTNIPSISSKQIGISWFAEPQKLTVKKKRRKIDESVSFFVTMK